MATKKAAGQKPVPPPVDNIDDEIPTHPPEVPETIAPPAEVPEVPVEGTQALPAQLPLEKVDKEKVDREKVLTFIEDIIDTLTFRRVALVALLTVIGLSLYALYENRQAIVENIVNQEAATGSKDPVPTSWLLSEGSKLAMQTLAKSTAVSFIAVTDVDLKKNRRLVQYYYVDDPSIKLSGEALRALGLPQAVFDYDAKNTAQMVAILSNEFKCDAFRDTIFFRYAPELENQIPKICRLAIPPFVGSFAGFITVGMDTASSKTELDSIRLEVSRIAVDIYLNDVIKRPATPQ